MSKDYLSKTVVFDSPYGSINAPISAFLDQEDIDEIIKNNNEIEEYRDKYQNRFGNKHKYKNDYLNYLNMTPWKNCNIESGWRLYFICWNCFNIFTKPIPGLRYKIINRLIPVFMKHRSKKIKQNKN